MTFQIRSFDFRAMSNDNAGISLGKLNDFIEAHTKVTEQVRELRHEEMALDASIEETENGLAQYEGKLSSEQLEEIRNYLGSANDRLCEVIEQVTSAEEIRVAHRDEIERIAEILAVTLKIDSFDCGYPTYCPVSEDVSDSKKTEEYCFNCNATVSEMVEEYNNVVTNHLCTDEHRVNHQRALIYHAARIWSMCVTRNEDGTLTLSMASN